MFVVLGVLFLEAITMTTSLLIARKNMLKNISEIGNRGYLVDWDKINQNNGINLEFDFGINIKSIFIPGLNIKQALDAKKNNNLLVNNPVLIPYLRKMTEKEKNEYNSLKTNNQKIKYITYKEKEEDFIEETEEIKAAKCEERIQEEAKVINDEVKNNNFGNTMYIEETNYGKSSEDNIEGPKLIRRK